MGFLSVILTSLFLNVGLCACVTVDMSSGTYIIDKNGCVDERQ